MIYIGNSSEVIDWELIVSSLRNKEGTFKGSNQKNDIHHNQKVADLRKIWQKAGYDGNHAVGWIDYEVPDGIVETFAEWIGINPIGAWITSVPPGYCVPWHPDYTDEEEELLSGGNVLRFSCHISEPKWGQIFVLEDHLFYMETQGNTYQWSNWQDWHGGMNMGLEPKFLFNFMAYAK